MRKTKWVAAALFLACSVVRVEAQNLHDFLSAVEAQAKVTAALRADGTIETVKDGSTHRDQVVLVLGPPSDLYIELRNNGTRTLLLDGGTRALRALKGGGSQEFPADAALVDSDFLREDLQSFRVDRFSDMRISDDSNGELTATLFPAKSQYSLLAMTFDREKKVPTKTIYYRDTLNNAVKMERFGGYTQIGGEWLPSTISMESFRLKTRTTLTMHWTAAPKLPADLFAADSLARPSQLDWPAAQTTTGQ